MEKTLTVDDVAGALQFTKRIVYGMIQAGDFDGVVFKVNTKWRFHAKRFDQWQTERADARAA